MRRVKEDPEREERITMEVVVDAYDAGERAMGWHCYLDDAMKTPFKARVIAKHPISPLDKGEEVEVLGMAPAEVCLSDMFASIRYGKKQFAVPLSQLRPLTDDADTLQAIEDWHYWLACRYQF
jgi:hypothetical protein